MSNLKKLKKLYFSILITIIAIILGSSAVNAVWFSGWKNGSNPLWTSREFYCVEHQDYFTVGDWNPIDTWTINSDDASHSNRILANILYNGIKTGQGGYNGRGEYQWAVWKWFYDNGRVNTEPVSSARYNLAFNETINPTPYSSGNAGLSVADSQVTMEGNIGSIKINSISGNVDKVEIIWKDPTNNKEYTKSISTGNSKEAGWMEFYSDKECKKPLNINDFKVGTIYVKNLKENYDIKKINMHVTNNASGYSVTVTRWRKSTGQASQQDLISATMKEGTPTDITIPLKVKYTYGELKIVKKGVYKEDGKAKEENIRADFKLYCSTLNKWVAGDANGNKTYVDSIDKATTYKSNIIVKRLLSSYKYQLVEVKVDENYKYYNNPIKMVAVTSDLQKDLKVTKKGNYYASSNVIVYSNRTNTVTVLDERTSGILKIIKTDENYKDLKLQGAKFKIYCKDKGWLIQNSDGTYKYDGDVKSATEFVSNEEGIVEIKCVKYGTYYAYETSAPEGYDIKEQDGYENKNGKDPYSYSKDNEWVYLGELKLDSSNNTAKYTFTNKKIVRLEGKVWIDKLDEDKASKEYDYVYTEKLDKLKSGIKVNLYNAKNDIISTTITDNNGHYEFNKLNYWDLAECYVEFEYDNKNYIVADPFVGKDIKINSKAMEETMVIDELQDEKLTGKEGLLPGRAITYKGGPKLSYDKILENNKSQNKDLTKTPLTGYYNNKTYTIEDINLGIMEKIVPSMQISQNLQYVKIAINNYTYTYKYGDPKVTNSQFVPTVQKQNEISYSPTKLYPSDIAYNIKNPGGLQVYLVYSIDVKNNMTDPIDDIYNEGRLYLNSLEVKYDANRFTLSKDSIGNIINNVDQNKQFEMWTGDNGVATYELGNDNDIYKDGLASEEIKTSYIQLKANNKLINAVLKGGDELNKLQEPTAAQVFAEGYHEYLRTDNVWIDDKNVTAFDGRRGEYTDKTKYKSNDKYYIHKSLGCKDNSSSLSMKFTLGENRVVSGTVFEDKKENNSTLGNGKLDQTEQNRANNLKVELLENGKPATIFIKDENNNVIETLASGISTDKDGNYKFEGVVPGYYVIRFTYSDGSQVMQPNGKSITSKDYKSTIISSDNGNLIESSMEAPAETIKAAQDTLIKYYNNEEVKGVEEAKHLLEWYKYLGNNKYSTAVDNIEIRKNMDQAEYTANNTGKASVMEANTPLIGISIENDNDKQPEERAITEKEKIEFNSFNFGLIEQIKTELKTSKKITNIKLTNQVGTTLFSETPSRKSTYVTALDTIAIENGAKTAKTEIQPDNIYGSNVEVKYEVSVKNTTPVDYVEDINTPEGNKHYGYYFKYGKKDYADVKKITVNEIEDDLDAKFNWDSLPKETTQTTSFTTRIQPQNIKLERATNFDGTEYVSMKGWEALGSGDLAKTEYTVTALVADDDNSDLAYSNDAKVSSLSLKPLSALTSDSTKIWTPDTTTFSIMPTTGENKDYTYWYIGAIALAIIGSGVILIKKKVL